MIVTRSLSTGGKERKNLDVPSRMRELARLDAEEKWKEGEEIVRRKEKDS